MPLVHRLDPGKNGIKVMWSKPLGAVRRAKIRRLRRRGRPGKVRRRTRGSPTTYLWPKLGSKVHRRAGSMAPGGNSRCELASGDVAARPGQYAALEAPWDPSEGV
jgi:hypothetical protein